jgi:hypothetical protein
MAAGRVDPWAGDVLALLLRVMHPKLLAPNHMWDVYCPACSTGHHPVLQQLLQLVLAAPAAHLPVLLKAAAAAGNRCVWEQLLGVQPSQQQQQQPPAGGGATGSSSSTSDSSDSNSASAAPSSGSGLQSQQQGQQDQPQQQGESGQPPQLPLECLSAGDWWNMLLELLSWMSPDRPVTSGPESLRVAADADRAAMADACWQVLDTLPAVPASSSSAGMLPQPRRAAVAAAARSYWEAAAREPGWLQQLLAEAPAGKLVWLLQHGLMPVLPTRRWPVSAALGTPLLNKVFFCLRLGQHTAAAALRRFAAQLGVEASAALLVEGCWHEVARRAAAGGAQAAAAVQQQTAFADYLEALDFLAQNGGIGEATLRKHELSTTDTLLAAVACSWNAAMLLEGRGLPQKVGLGVPQHLQLCAAAVGAAFLQHIPQITCGEVQQLLAAVATATTCDPPPRSPALDALRQRPAWLLLQGHMLDVMTLSRERILGYLDGVYAVLCAAALDVRDVLRLRGLEIDGLSVLQSLEELRFKYVAWMACELGAERLVVPMRGYMHPLPEYSMVRGVCDGMRLCFVRQCSTAVTAGCGGCTACLSCADRLVTDN